MDTSDKKTEILKAASSCFARYGYEKTTLDDIGKIVGLNKASLYYYYKNKENIYTEVIYTEANMFLHEVIKEVEKMPDCKTKVLTYLTERLKYMQTAVNLEQLTTSSIQQLAPLFTEMYNRIVEKEIAYLSDVLQSSIENAEIIACDVNRIAKNIITVTEGIKSRLVCGTNCSDIPANVHLEVVEEVLFTVSLIMEGLKKQ